MTTKTYKISTTITASIVVDFECIQQELAEARRVAETEADGGSVHPMTLKMIRDGKSDEEILEMVVKHGTTLLFKDVLKKNSDKRAPLYYKGFEVITKVSE